ncbi:hypothetical protein BDN72DRAFT_854112 [Pluteus cervinus]|uniref:Uncharacterized protein n=1 Tax=Pluteus cervinus TaxID=181527 RepID=A0ACD3B9A1_9AGAR|nr:hypothetical protein BDN72DRAFT_854112 [Pluteus cervinus]
MKGLHLRAHTAHDVAATPPANIRDPHHTSLHGPRSWKKYYSFLRFGKKHPHPRRSTTTSATPAQTHPNPNSNYAYPSFPPTHLVTPLPGPASSSVFISPSPSPPAHSNATSTSNERSDPNPCAEFDLEDINFEIYQSEPNERISSWNGKPTMLSPNQYQSLCHSYSFPVLSPRPLALSVSTKTATSRTPALPPTPPPKSLPHRAKYIPLPSELWFEIALHLPPPTICNLSLTSRPIRNAILPFLFQRISFDSSLTPGQSVSDYFADLVRRVSFLAGVSGIRSYVKEILIAPRRGKRWKSTSSSLSPRSYSPSTSGGDDYGGGGVPLLPVSMSLDNQGTRMMVELGMDLRLLTNSEQTRRPGEHVRSWLHQQDECSEESEICDTGVDFIFNHLRAWPNLRSLTLSGIVLSYERMNKLEELGMDGLRDLRLIGCKEMEEVDLLAFRVSIKNVRFDDLHLDEPEDDVDADNNSHSIPQAQALPLTSQLPAPFLDSQSVETLVTGTRTSKITLSWIIKSKSPYYHLTFLSIPVSTFYRPEVVSAFRQCPNVRHLQLHMRGMMKGNYRSIHNLPGLIPHEVLTKLEWYEGPFQFAQLFCGTEGAENTTRSRLSSSRSSSPPSTQTWSPRPFLKKVTLLPQNDTVIFVNPITLVENCLNKLPTDLEELEVRLVTQVGWTIMRAVKERFGKLRRMSLCCGEDGEDSVGGDFDVGERRLGAWGTRGMCRRKKGINVPVPTNVRDLKVVIGGPPVAVVEATKLRVHGLEEEEEEESGMDLDPSSSMESAPFEDSLHDELEPISESDLPISEYSSQDQDQDQEEEIRTEFPGIGLPVTLEELEVGVRINPDIYEVEKEAMADLVGAFVWQCWNARRVRMVFGFGEGEGEVVCRDDLQGQGKERRKVAVWRRGFCGLQMVDMKEGKEKEVWQVGKEDLSIVDIEDEVLDRW